MFSKKKDKSSTTSQRKTVIKSPKFLESKSSFATTIGKGISIEGGIIAGDGNVCINGYYVGDITIKGHVEIGVSGAVYGDISASSIVIAGNSKGNIETIESIRLASTAVVEGILKSKTIIMDENAIFNGICKMESQVQLPSKDPSLSQSYSG